MFSQRIASEAGLQDGRADYTAAAALAALAPGPRSDFDAFARAV